MINRYSAQNQTVSEKDSNLPLVILYNDGDDDNDNDNDDDNDDDDDVSKHVHK